MNGGQRPLTTCEHAGAIDIQIDLLLAVDYVGQGDSYSPAVQNCPSKAVYELAHCEMGALLSSRLSSWFLSISTS